MPPPFPRLTTLDARLSRPSRKYRAEPYPYSQRARLFDKSSCATTDTAELNIDAPANSAIASPSQADKHAFPLSLTRQVVVEISPPPKDFQISSKESDDECIVLIEEFPPVDDAGTCLVDVQEYSIPQVNRRIHGRGSLRSRSIQSPQYTVDPLKGEARFRAVPTVGFGVEVGPSTIADAGRGLFATRNFRRMELVTEYTGEIITRDESVKRLRRGQFHYLGTLTIGLYEIDGIQLPEHGKGGASFINHAAPPHTNVTWARFEDKKAWQARLFARATRDIQAGEEIFLNYGKRYWENHRKWKEAIERGVEHMSDESLSSGEIGSDNEPLWADFCDKPAPPPSP